tara:strand:- start:240 stop:515 length:276 start_codon:yes stop_codon:yes gene_type:complete
MSDLQSLINQIYKEYRSWDKNDEDCWVMMRSKGKMFDVNFWYSNKNNYDWKVSVYECYKNEKGFWDTDFNSELNIDQILKKYVIAQGEKNE